MKWNKQILEKEGKRRLPSFNEIVEGIILEAVSQLRKHSGLARDSQELLQAQNNITKSWHEHFFSQIELSDSDKPLERNELGNPDHPVTNLLLYMQTIESFLYINLNHSSISGDFSETDALGAYASAFGVIMSRTAKERKDIPELKNKIEKEGICLFRAASFTEDKIKEFKELVGKTTQDSYGKEVKVLTQLFGHTSTF